MPDVIAALFSWPYVVAFALLPLIAIGVLWSSRTSQGAALNTATAYTVWVLAGFLGFHRMYLKNTWWMLYIPLLAVFLYAWVSETRADTAFSAAKTQLENVDSVTARQNARAASATTGIEKARAKITDATSISEEETKRLELEIERESARATEARAEIAKIEAETPVLKTSLTTATNSRRFWSDIAFKTLLAIFAFMLIDALLIPSMKRAAELRERSVV